MPAEETPLMMMMQGIHSSQRYSQQVPFNHQPSNALLVGANLRSGKAAKPEETPFEAALKAAPEHPKKLLNLVKDWIAVNHPTQPLSDEALLNLLNSVKQANNGSADAIWQTVQEKVGSPLKENASYVNSLKQQIKECVTGGKTEVNKWLQAFVVLQYVPSTVVTIMTTLWINKELEKAKKITKKEEKLLNNQEMARQLVGVVIHCLQASASFALVDGIAWAGKKNHVVRKQAEQWLAKTEGWKGFNQTVGKGLHKTADTLQWSWNTLNEGHNKTGLSLGFVMLSNLLSYGIMRPLLVNTTFIGIKDATETPTVIAPQKPKTSMLPAVLPPPSYVEQVRLAEIATVSTAISGGTALLALNKPITPKRKPVATGAFVNPTVSLKTPVHTQSKPVEAGHSAATHHPKHHHGRFHAQSIL
jgi:hypothetical protein